MTELPDNVLAHLCGTIDLPDFAGTRYDLREEIGRGGMGTVYRAHDRLLDRDVALKVVDAEAGLEEASVLARLEHPGIVPVYDAGELPDGRRFAAMRLVEGERLDQFLARESTAGASLSARLRVYLRVCDAVSFAHRAGVAHCDLKPHNIMVAAFGQVFVMDWGIAVRGARGLREPVAGTARYMAPELTAGPARDVYAMGRLLEDMVAQASAPPLLAVAARASAARPEDRYRGVDELAAEVVRYLDRLPVLAYRESLLERARRFAARNQTLLILLGAYILVRLGLFLSSH